MNLNATQVFSSLLLILAAMAGCSTDDLVDSLAGPKDSGQPVKDQPLSGTIEGKPFTAKVAIGNKPLSGTMFVNVYDEDATCDKAVTNPASGRSILMTFSQELKEGQITELGFGEGKDTVTFTVQENATDTPLNIIVASGRIELRKVPVAKTETTPAVDGLIGIRGNSGSDDIVEGTVKFVLCE